MDQWEAQCVDNDETVADVREHVTLCTVIPPRPQSR